MNIHCNILTKVIRPIQFDSVNNVSGCTASYESDIQYTQVTPSPCHMGDTYSEVTVHEGQLQ